MNRTLMIPLSLADDDQYRAVIGSINEVRAASRKVFAVLFAAQAAGADIQWDDDNMRVTPNDDAAKAILAQTLGKDGKAHVYQARRYVLEHLLSDYRSFVFDELRRNVSTRWRAKDAEFPKATRGYLTLNGVRHLAMFNSAGIGFPKATATIGMADHRLSLRWCDRLGIVDFRVGTLEPARWRTWKRIVDGDLPHGTIQLNERNGKVRAYVTYKVEATPQDLDNTRRLTVSLSDDGTVLCIVGPDGQRTYDSISLADARDWLERLHIQRERWERRRACAGSPRKPWGEPRRVKSVTRHLRHVTQTRINGQRHRNHAWSKRIVTRAADWRCGVVEFAIDTAEIGGYPWQWTQLRKMIEYKLEPLGGKLSDITVQKSA